MKPRFDVLTWHIMDATADDWESIIQVVPHVEYFLGPQNFDEIQKIILRLIDEDLFELMLLEGKTLDSLKTDIERCWFSMSREGRRLWEADGIYYRNEEAEQDAAANP